MDPIATASGGLRGGDRFAKSEQEHPSPEPCRTVGFIPNVSCDATTREAPRTSAGGCFWPSSFVDDCRSVHGRGV
jgi:hypothetical protein